MESNKGVGALGIFLGVIAGGLALSWWKESRKAKDSSTVDTGEKTSDGKPIVEVTGVGGTDNGVKVRGYELPSSIDDVVVPIEVVVRPNKELFLVFKVGEKVTFVRKRSDELIYIMTTGAVTGEYTEWYPELRKKVLGAV